MIAVALIAPVATSASSRLPLSNGGKCYEQVSQYKYQRETYKTQYQYQKQTSERSRNDKHDAWGPWSAWTWWSPALVPVVVRPTSAVLESGDHDGQNDNNSTYDRDYQYVPNGVTEQVANGYENSGWVAAAAGR